MMDGRKPQNTNAHSTALANEFLLLWYVQTRHDFDTAERTVRRRIERKVGTDR